MKKFWLGLIAIFALQTVVLAQDHYAVQVGIFLNPRLSDFESIRPLGFLYAETEQGSTYRVFVGDFDNAKEAESIEKQLKQRGYLDAFVARRSTTLGSKTAVIQVATRLPKDRINWDEFLPLGNIYVLAEGNQVKLVTGAYRDLNEAKADLARVRKSGFKDAFPKNVNSARLHEIGTFELGDYKRDLIPIDFDRASGAITRNERRPSGYDTDFGVKGEPTYADRTPPSYNYEPVSTPEPKPANFDLPTPKIRTNVKRKSVLDLQTVLKRLGTYKSSLDGYYGDGTASGFAQAANNDLAYQKYQLLSKYSNELESKGTASNVQRAVNNLPQMPSVSLRTLESSKLPVAKAYRAYWLFQQQNTSSRAVNDLMNTAIREAFRQQNKNSAAQLPIDARTTYAYEDLNQVARHIYYIHLLQSERIIIPCWMMGRHASEVGSSSFYVSDECNGFYQWEVVRVLKSVSDDLSTTTPTQDGTTLTRLYLSPATLSRTEIQGLNSWNDILWQNLDTWASRDPLHGKTVTALKLAYFQTQVQLEDHFMDKGFSATQAKGLALASLQAMVGENLERFI
ncbi:MAG: SPOR domain-containing protein [Bacteroidota bacterium]